MFSFLAVSVGITNLLVNSVLMEPIRGNLTGFFEKKDMNMLAYMINCMMCSGFWVGLIISSQFTLGINFVFAGAISSLFSHIYSELIDYMNKE